MSTPTTTRAILASIPTPTGPNWSLETLTFPAHLQPDEVLVQIVATGICHTDLVLTSIPQGYLGIQYPKVAGHEGSGYVRAVGKDVTKVALGDPVLLSFDYCKSCHMCEGDQPGFCEEFDDRNFVGSDSHFATEKGEKTWGQFFGQSSFANWSVVKAASVLNAKDLVRNEEELKLFAPLGCGIQTGSGAIVNAAKAGPEDRVLVMGLGGVGLSAIMAAKIAGCKTIIGMDRVAGRLELARELGATHVVNTAGFEGGMEGVVKEVRKIADGVGVTVAIDTTGAPPVLDHCMQMIARRGKMIIIGVAPPDYEFKVGSLTAFMSSGRILMGSIEGDSIPEQHIPKMIQWYREGKFPIDKLIQFKPVEKFEEGVAEMHSGACVKPVLIW